MFKKKDEYRKDSRKIEIISKNQSDAGLPKKPDSHENNSVNKHSKEVRIRIPLHEESHANRSVKHDQSREKKEKEKYSHKKSLA